jgi:drug/metabolite transporter (DMT)-like permease
MTAGLTALALIAFAGNSLLCRLALAAGAADAASFTAVRLASGALVLGALARARLRAGSWASAAALFLYAAPFSFAYLRLGAGVGALILFAAVQATMFAWGIRARGERPRAQTWLGMGLALGGLAWLTVPGASAPDPLGASAMAVAGVAWGVYSLRGRGVADPLATTAAAFVRSVPFAALLVGGQAAAGGLHASPRGVALAAASGAVASGLGYTIWYAALRGLTATRAAVLQLLVPVLAALGGVAVLGERPSPRFLVAAAAILGGVALAVLTPPSSRRGA